MSDALEPVEVAVTVRDEPPSAIVQSGISPFDLDPAVFQAALDRRRANMKALLKWLGEEMKEGVHYGKIHVVSKEKCPKGKWCKDPNHFSKDVLFKPGAELLNQRLGLTARYPSAPEFEAKALRGEHVEVIILRCELVSGSGQVVSEGMGARSVKADYGDINKALKMAEKSARINATLQLGLSDCYTQDLEDMVEEDLTPKLEASIAAAEAKKNAALDARCPECASITEVYASTQKGANAGRKYRQCKFAHDAIMDDMAQGVEAKLAYAAQAKHLREWIEPARKVAQGAVAPESGSRPEPPPTEEPAPSIFEQLENISREQERKWAK